MDVRKRGSAEGRGTDNKVWEQDTERKEPGEEGHMKVVAVNDKEEPPIEERLTLNIWK